MMSYYNAILADWMKNKSMNETAAAKLFEVDQSYISKILNGHRKPSPKLARRISGITGIPLEALLFPEDEKKEK